MKAMFGLAGLLIVVGVIVWWMGSPGGMLDQQKQAIKTGNEMRSQVSQIAGTDANTGRPASESADLASVPGANGRVTGLLVTRLDSGGAYEQYFKLQKNDTIMAVEYQGVRQNIRDFTNVNDIRNEVLATYQRKGSLYVSRDDKEVKLPPAPPPGTPAKKDSVQQTLDALQGVPK